MRRCTVWRTNVYAARRKSRENWIISGLACDDDTDEVLADDRTDPTDRSEVRDVLTDDRTDPTHRREERKINACRCTEAVLGVAPSLECGEEAPCGEKSIMSGGVVGTSWPLRRVCHCSCIAVATCSWEVGAHTGWGVGSICDQVYMSERRTCCIPSDARGPSSKSSSR